MFELIKSTFNKQDDYVNFELTENSFNAIEACEKSFLNRFDFSFSYISIQQVVENYLKERVTKVQNDIEEFFKNIICFANEFEAIANAEKLMKLLKEIQVAEKYKTCSKFYRFNSEALNLIWEKRLNREFKESEKLFKRLNPSDDRKEILSVLAKANVFAHVDEFLEVSTSASSSQLSNIQSLVRSLF